jgi:hypothetical protein
VKPQFELAQIVQQHLSSFIKRHPQSKHNIKTLNAIAACRTAVLGGHKAACTNCHAEKYFYNSCRNRHCPKCQSVNRERWIIQREAELLPVPYFHVVFTIPHALNDLAREHPTVIYNALFKAAWQTIKTLSSDPKHLGAKTGMTAILHTWGQQLWLHPHLHCIIPAGGITPQGKWKNTRLKGKYLFPQKAMAKLFRAKFTAALREHIKIPQQVAKSMYSKDWIVYAKRPFSTPKTVVEYLGRYTHKVAISNHRFTEITKDKVTFKYKDYRHQNQTKLMILQSHEFLNRYSQHILPHGFVRMRHYGILASKNKAKELNIAKRFFNQKPWEKVRLTWLQIALEKLDIDPTLCTKCKTGRLELAEVIHPERGPPLVASFSPNQNFLKI